jgi:UPF0176 protein
VVPRTRHFAKFIQPQFARGEVRKTYLARVQGAPANDTFICEAPISIDPGDAGTREVDHENGCSARTEFKVLKRCTDGTTLLEVTPMTGRTNQIRIHAWELGFPICGDPAYQPGKRLGTTQTLAVTDPPLCLHAWKLEFTHPLTKERVEFVAPPPPFSSLA